MLALAFVKQYHVAMQIFLPRPHAQRDTPGRRFWPRVDRGHPMDCWNWRGHCYSNGYGKLIWEGTRTNAHRVAFAVSGGALVPGMVIMHLCDNPLCCNPAHLKQGSHSDNTRDAIAKGRWPQLQRQKSVCGRGHSMSNAYMFKNGSRCCRACHYLRRNGLLTDRLRSPARPR